MRGCARHRRPARRAHALCGADPHGYRRRFLIGAEGEREPGAGEFRYRVFVDNPQTQATSSSSPRVIAATALTFTTDSCSMITRLARPRRMPTRMVLPRTPNAWTCGTEISLPWCTSRTECRRFGKCRATQLPEAPPASRAGAAITTWAMESVAEQCGRTRS